jgi:hypothetical protein
MHIYGVSILLVAFLWPYNRNKGFLKQIFIWDWCIQCEKCIFLWPAMFLIGRFPEKISQYFLQTDCLREGQNSTLPCATAKMYRSWRWDFKSPKYDAIEPAGWEVIPWAHEISTQAQFIFAVHGGTYPCSYIGLTWRSAHTSTKAYQKHYTWLHIAARAWQIGYSCCHGCVI